MRPGDPFGWANESTAVSSKGCGKDNRRQEEDPTDGCQWPVVTLPKPPQLTCFDSNIPGNLNETRKKNKNKFASSTAAHDQTTWLHGCTKRRANNVHARPRFWDTRDYGPKEQSPKATTKLTEKVAETRPRPNTMFVPCSTRRSSPSWSRPTACCIHVAFDLTVRSTSRYIIPGVLDTILVTLAEGKSSCSFITCGACGRGCESRVTAIVWKR